MSKLFPNAVMCIRTLYRSDIVGSFLHPGSLKQVRCRCACGECGFGEMRHVEDREIATLITKEKAISLPNVTDSESRCTWWHPDLLLGLLGVELAEAEEYNTKLQAHMYRPVTLKVADKIESPNTHPFLVHFKALQEEAGDHPVRFTILSPSVLHSITRVCMSNPQLIKHYTSRSDLLLADITAAYVKTIDALYGAGCRTLRLDDVSWDEFCPEEKCAPYQVQGADVDATTHSYVKTLNDIRATAPADMVLTMYVCRDNFRPTWFSSDDYEPVAEILFGGCNVDGSFLEYDNDRAGSFKPLRFTKSQQVVLGLVTSKSGELEDRGVVIGRIKEVARYVDINQLCLSPQCGFASAGEGNVLTEEEQWKKLALICNIVEEVWGNV